MTTDPHIHQLDPGQEASASPYRDPVWAQAVIESAVDAIVTIDQQGIIGYVNRAVEKLFGYSRAELLGQNVSILMPAPHKAQHDGYLRKYLETGEARIIGVGREISGRRKDGTTFPMRLAVSEFREGEEVYFTGVIHDISREKLAEEEKERALTELHKRNIEIATLYRLGEALREMEDVAQLMDGVLEIIPFAFAYPEITRVRITFDGVTYALGDHEEHGDLLSAPLTVAGNVRGFISLFCIEELGSPNAEAFCERDPELLNVMAAELSAAIERRDAEAQVIQASKLASIGELAAGVAHEINNPVNGIMNCADIILARSEPDSPSQRYASLIRSESDRIARIVSNLLTFSRQEKERHSPARIRDIVDAVLALCKKKIEKSHIDLRVDVPKDLPKLKCRSEQLQQVLMNLIINSMHALDDRYPERNENKVLTISAALHGVKDSASIRLTVEDFGTGIRRGIRSRLFDPFFTTKGRDKGTGLGLSVSDGIVKDHGGKISLESEYGKFARFHVDLPLDNGWYLEEEDAQPGKDA